MSDDIQRANPGAETLEYIQRLRLETDRIDAETCRLIAKRRRTQAQWELHWWGRWAMPLTFLPGLTAIFLVIVILLLLHPHHG